MLNSHRETVYREQIAEVESTVDGAPGFGEPEHMSNRMQIGFLGCGNMGGAILEGMLSEQLHQPSEVLVCEHSAEKRAYWQQRGVSVTDSEADAQGLETLVIAVKPQGFTTAAAQLGLLAHSTLAISVMAGIDSVQISGALGPNARVIRVMPNTPCAIGMGISAVAIGTGAAATDLEEAVRLMSTVGEVVTVKESAMHAVTATSGSGPAYLFYLAESWINAGISAGLPPEVARTLVIETIRGSGELLKQSGDPVGLRKMVTSPGGTTAAGIRELEEHDLHRTMEKAVRSAHARSEELGRED